MWNLLIQPLVGLVSTHLNNKAEAKQAVHKSNLKKIESESSWENNQSINAIDLDFFSSTCISQPRAVNLRLPGRHFVVRLATIHAND